MQGEEDCVGSVPDLVRLFHLPIYVINLTEQHAFIEMRFWYGLSSYFNLADTTFIAFDRPHFLALYDLDTYASDRVADEPRDPGLSVLG